jgi:hypothetical protein
MSGQKRTAVERPLKLLRRATDEGGIRDSQWQQRREEREHSELVFDAGDNYRASRKAKNPLVVDEPDGGVPALAQQSQGSPLEL